MEASANRIPRLVGVCGYARAGKDTIAEMLSKDWGFKRVAFADKLRAFAYGFDSPLGEGVRYRDVADDPSSADRFYHLKKLTILIEDLLTECGPGVKERVKWDVDKLARALNLTLVPTDPTLTYARLINSLGYEGAKAAHPKLIRPHLVLFGDLLREYVYPAIWIECCLGCDINEFHRKFGPTQRVVVSDVRYDNERIKVHEYAGVVWYVERDGVGPANVTEGESVPLVKYDTKVTNDGESMDNLYHTVQEHMSAFVAPGRSV